MMFVWYWVEDCEVCFCWIGDEVVGVEVLDESVQFCLRQFVEVVDAGGGDEERCVVCVSINLRVGNRFDDVVDVEEEEGG